MTLSPVCRPAASRHHRAQWPPTNDLTSTWQGKSGSSAQGGSRTPRFAAGDLDRKAPTVQRLVGATTTHGDVLMAAVTRRTVLTGLAATGVAAGARGEAVGRDRRQPAAAATGVT